MTPMIFLIAAPRSGSTMLEHMLSSHSMIQGGPEPHLLTPLAHLGYHARVDAAPYDPVAAAEGLTSFVNGLRGGQSAYLDACRAYCEVLYGRYLSQGEKTFCLDKTPAYALILPFLADVFPDAKYVVLTRHPLAVFSSYANSFFAGDYESALAYNPILNRYVPAMAAFLRQRDVPFVHIRYEDLVREPEDGMRKVCDYLGVPFEADAIEYGKHRTQQSSQGLGDPIGVRKHTRPTTASVAKWVEELASDPKREAMMRRVINELDGADLRLLGYPPESLWSKLEQYQGTRRTKRETSLNRYSLQRKAIVGLRAFTRRNQGVRRVLTLGRSACHGLLRD